MPHAYTTQRRRVQRARPAGSRGEDDGHPVLVLSALYAPSLASSAEFRSRRGRPRPAGFCGILLVCRCAAAPPLERIHEPGGRNA